MSGKVSWGYVEGVGGVLGVSGGCIGDVWGISEEGCLKCLGGCLEDVCLVSEVSSSQHLFS